MVLFHIQHMIHMKLHYESSAAYAAYVSLFLIVKECISLFLIV